MKTTDKYIKNHLNNNAPHDGCMFETYGTEYNYVLCQPRMRIDTIVEENGIERIEKGFHWVNRLGYLIKK